MYYTPGMHTSKYTRKVIRGFYVAKQYTPNTQEYSIGDLPMTSEN